MDVRLYDWRTSPFCLKVRSILDHKGIAYRRINVLGRGLIDVIRRGRIGKVPALEIDGELICDSTDIALELDARVPEPALLPEGERDRALCLGLEDWADEALYWIGVYYHWHDSAGRANLHMAFGSLPFGRAAQAVYQRRMLAQLRGQGTGRKPPGHVRRDLERALEIADGLLGQQRFLIDEHPRLCDFAVAAQLVYLSYAPVGADALRSHPLSTDFIARMKSLRRSRAAA